MLEKALNNKDDRRVIIVDFNPLVHSYMFGGAPALSHTVVIDGKPTLIDTTIQTYTIKAIHRWSNHGRNPVAVCFDSPCKSRKFYFAKYSNMEGSSDAVEYKGGRKRLPDKAFLGMNMTAGLLNNAGVSVYRKDNYEADDLIKACVDMAKEQYPDLPIDIIANDADMLPLVDDQVSVFLRTKKQAWAESKDIEKPHYIQVTPRNFQDVVQGISSYKKLSIPYNSVLLAKLLRGDKSDNVPAHPTWKPKLYNELVGILEDNADDLAGLFRYGNGDQLDKICEVLDKYIEEEDIEHIKFVYKGINLNGDLSFLPGEYSRPPVVLKTPIRGYLAGKLQQEVIKLNINLPV